MGGAVGAAGDKINATAGNVGEYFDDRNPWVQKDRKAKEKAEKDREALDQLMEDTKHLNPQLDIADAKYKEDFDAASQQYLGTAKGLVGNWQNEIDSLSNQAKGQASDARETYTNTILPELKTHLAGAKNNAAGAMTLAMAQDPNNPLVTQIRELYNRMGMDANLQGQQDFGVLSALGAQAAQGQFGAAGPMTAGMQGQIYAANQRQAGDAYAKAQQRMYDLQQQGIAEGWRQNEHWYNQGQLAQDRYGQSIAGLQDGENKYYNQQGDFRDEISGYAGQTLGVQSGLNADTMNIGMMGADIDKGNVYAGVGREQDRYNQQYGIGQGISDNEFDSWAANNASKGQFISAVIGALLGGAGGAVAGSAANSSAGGS